MTLSWCKKYSEFHLIVLNIATHLLSLMKKQNLPTTKHSIAMLLYFFLAVEDQKLQISLLYTTASHALHLSNSRRRDTK
jgi:hypothetical protein